LALSDKSYLSDFVFFARLWFFIASKKKNSLLERVF